MDLKLAHGVGFADLYSRDGLTRLDGLFLEALTASDTGLANRLLAARAAPEGVATKDESELLIALAPHLESFVGRLFGIEDAIQIGRAHV